MLQAANDIELLSLDQLRSTIGHSILYGIIAMPKMMTPGMVIRFDKAKLKSKQRASELAAEEAATRVWRRREVGLLLAKRAAAPTIRRQDVLPAPPAARPEAPSLAAIPGR